MASSTRKLSGAFMLRETLDTVGTTYQETSIDISSFVNALQGEVLRVKQVWFEWTSDNGGAILGADVGANQGASGNAQLMTESSTTIQPFTNNSMIAKNNIYVHANATSDIDFIAQDSGLNPYDFEDGYIVPTDAIFLAVNQSADSFASNIRVSVLMECEIVKLSKKDLQAVLVAQTLG